eukprot:4551635-Pyramimonas_sp.AAC.1
MEGGSFSTCGPRLSNAHIRLTSCNRFKDGGRDGFLARMRTIPGRQDAAVMSARRVEIAGSCALARPGVVIMHSSR